MLEKTRTVNNNPSPSQKTKPSLSPPLSSIKSTPLHSHFLDLPLDEPINTTLEPQVMSPTPFLLCDSPTGTPHTIIDTYAFFTPTSCIQTGKQQRK